MVRERRGQEPKQSGAPVNDFPNAAITRDGRYRRARFGQAAEVPNENRGCQGSDFSEKYSQRDRRFAHANRLRFLHGRSWGSLPILPAKETESTPNAADFRPRRPRRDFSARSITSHFAAASAIDERQILHGFT
jgi:hypothetical protein